MVCICFPKGTLVTTKQGVKKIQDLQPADDVLTLSRQRGVQQWTKFYTWGHNKPELATDFIVFTTGDGDKLQISKDHLIYVAGKGGRIAKKAGDVSQDDKLYHLKKVGGFQLSQIIEINVQKISGVYANFNMKGDFLVNGFLVASYTRLEEFQKTQNELAPLREYMIRRHSH